jgi:hypothetical protein
MHILRQGYLYQGTVRIQDTLFASYFVTLSCSYHAVKDRQGPHRWGSHCILQVHKMVAWLNATLLSHGDPVGEVPNRYHNRRLLMPCA